MTSALVWSWVSQSHWVATSLHTSYGVNTKTKVSQRPSGPTVISTDCWPPGYSSVCAFKPSTPPKKDLNDLVFTGISSKKQAGSRQPPNLLQLQFAMARLVHHAQSGGSRKSATELLMDCIKDHQKREEVRRAKLSTNEIKGLKTVFRMDTAFQRRLKLIWGKTN